MAVDANGYFYVSSPAGNDGVIHKVSPTGTYLGIFASADVPLYGLAFDPDGHLWVASPDEHSLREYGAAGELLGTLPLFYDDGDGRFVPIQPIFIATTAVPEPSTLALAAPGVLGITMFQLRRRKSQARDRVL